MPKHGKKYNEAKNSFDSKKAYPIAEAVELLKKVNYSKFDGSVDIAIKTNANPKFNDQMIRSTVVLPHGTGKSKKIAVFISPDKVADAKKAGADIVGNEDLINNIKEGKFNFDILLTTPEHIRDLAPVAKALGPKGLMPSPKAGTVSQNIENAIEEFKKGKLEFRVDKTGNIHCSVGKTSFDDTKLIENIQHFIKTVEDNKPVGVKGKLMKKITISPTMGPGIMIEF